MASGVQRGVETKVEGPELALPLLIHKPLVDNHWHTPVHQIPVIELKTYQTLMVT